MFEIAQNAPCGECFESIPQAKDEVLHWPMKEGYGKAGKQKTLSNFPTATTTTNYNYLWDSDSEGKIIGLSLRDPSELCVRVASERNVSVF